MADGKIFVGTESGKFFIVRPHPDRAEILSEVELPVSKDSIGGSEGTAEQVFGGAAISRGRIFFATTDAVYAVGPKQKKDAEVDGRSTSLRSSAKAPRRLCRWPRQNWWSRRVRASN